MEEGLAPAGLNAKLNAYQEQAKKTAIYPGAGWDAPFPAACGWAWTSKERKTAITYLALGLAGESSEFSEAWTEAKQESEFGDMLWYAAEIARWLGSPLAKFVIFDEVDFVTFHTVRTGGGQNAVCRLCEAAKKTMRDGESDARNENIARALTACLYSASRYVPLSRWPAIMDANLEKLKGRAERGTLKGDGEGR